MGLIVIMGILFFETLVSEHITKDGLVIRVDCIFNSLNCPKILSGLTTNIFLNIWRHFRDSLVSLAAVFSIVTQRSSCGEERCVTILKTAARETSDS